MKKSAVIVYLLLQVFYSGYAQEKQANMDSLFNLSLEQLMNMEVTVASKKAEKLSDAPGVISVLTREDIERFGGISLKDLLERVPSLNTLSASFTDVNAVASRGDMVKSTSSHVLILINGRPSREIQEGGIVTDMLSAFPVNIIERIEVIRGPGSVLYGSNAMSAVINIVTKAVEKNNIAYTEIFGKGGATGRTLTAQFAAKDLKVTLAGRMLKKQDQTYQYTYPVTDYFGNVSDTTTITATSPDQSLGGYMNVAYKGLHLTASLQDYKGLYIDNNVAGTNRWKKYFYNAGYDFSVSQNWKSSINTTLNWVTMVTGASPFIDRKSTDLVTEWTNYFTLSDRVNLTAGVLYNKMEGREISTNPTSLIDTISHGTRNALAAYAQMDYWAMPNKLKVIGGFQANKMEKLDLDVVPRLGLIYYPTERINIKALYGKAFRAGTINETSINYLGFFVGNPNLKPEHVENFDLGINYQGKKGQIGVNYFHSTQQNSIVQGPKMNAQGNPDAVDLGGGFMFPIITYNNIQSFSIQGIELEGKYYATKQIYFTGSLLGQKLDSNPVVNKNLFGGSDTTHIKSPVPNFGIKAGLSYASDRGITVSVFNIYQGKVKDGLYPSNGLNPNASKSYDVLNLYVNFDMIKIFNLNSTKKLSFYMQQENLLDNQIWSNHATAVSPYAMGRSIYFGLTVGL